MREEELTQAAQRVAASFASFDPHARFRAVIDEVTGYFAANVARRSREPRHWLAGNPGSFPFLLSGNI
jgi:hypothetical protein